MAQRAFTYDNKLLMKDAGLVAASAAATVAAAAKVLDLGAGRVEGTVVIDVSAVEVATGDEGYQIEWQLSPDATFGTAANIRCSSTLKLGDSTVNGSGADSTVGHFELPVVNEFQEVVYRYARLYTRVVGTIATGINYTAFLSKAA